MYFQPIINTRVGATLVTQNFFQEFENTKKIEDNFKNKKILKEEKKLKEACQELESIFIEYLWKIMRKTSFKSKILNNSFSEDLFTQMLDRERARIMAKSGGIGLSTILFNHLKKLKD